MFSFTYSCTCLDRVFYYRKYLDVWSIYIFKWIFSDNQWWWLVVAFLHKTPRPMIHLTVSDTSRLRPVTNQHTCVTCLMTSLRGRHGLHGRDTERGWAQEREMYVCRHKPRRDAGLWQSPSAYGWACAAPCQPRDTSFVFRRPRRPQADRTRWVEPCSRR